MAKVASLLFMIYERLELFRSFMLPLQTVTVCCFQKGLCKNEFGVLFFLVATLTGDVLQKPRSCQIPDNRLPVLHFTSGTRAGWHYGCVPQLSPSISNPPTGVIQGKLDTRHSAWTHTRARTSVSRSRLSELKPSRATWVVVTLYLITFSQAASKCCSGSVGRKLVWNVL